MHTVYARHKLQDLGDGGLDIGASAGGARHCDVSALRRHSIAFPYPRFCMLCSTGLQQLGTFSHPACCQCSLVAPALHQGVLYPQAAVGPACCILDQLVFPPVRDAQQAKGREQLLKRQADRLKTYTNMYECTYMAKSWPKGICVWHSWT